MTHISVCSHRERREREKKDRIGDFDLKLPETTFDRSKKQRD
jgi:hypothetical protein